MNFFAAIHNAVIQPIAKFSEQVFSKESYDITIEGVVNTWKTVDGSFKQWWMTVQPQLENAWTATRHFFVRLWLKMQPALKILWEATKAFCVQMWNDPVIRWFLLFGLSLVLVMIFTELGEFPAVTLDNAFPLLFMIIPPLLEPKYDQEV